MNKGGLIDTKFLMDSHQYCRGTRHCMGGQPAILVYRHYCRDFAAMVATPSYQLICNYSRAIPEENRKTIISCGNDLIAFLR